MQGIDERLQVIGNNFVVANINVRNILLRVVPKDDHIASLSLSPCPMEYGLRHFAERHMARFAHISGLQNAFVLFPAILLSLAASKFPCLMLPYSVVW